MTAFVRGLAALMCILLAVAPAIPQDRIPPASERDRISYVIGMDVGQSLSATGPDIDLAAFERAVRNAFDGGEPLVDAKTAAEVGAALAQRAAFRKGQRIPGLAPGVEPAEVDRTKAGLVVGAEVARTLMPVRDEIELPVFVQAVRTMLSGGTPLLSDQEVAAATGLLQRRVREAAAHKAEQARRAGREFLASNRAAEGVFETPSGLQYQVVRQGSGRRPMPSDRVKVHYRGTLLDGTVFDSSYERGMPAEFGLGQVIPGWTEGLGLMTVGAKYRFWIPPALGYGEKGAPPSIPPDSVLVFEVELLDIL